MTTGLRFTFTQNEFDLICSDLDRFSVAQAVAASAAFPVGMTPITLTNYSPCTAPNDELSRVVNNVNDVLHSEAIGEDGVRRGAGDTLFVAPRPNDPGSALTARFRGLRHSRSIKTPLSDEEKAYLHLLDGGIADNLGLDAVLSDIWEVGAGGSEIGDGARDRIKEVFFLVVNARADQNTARDEAASPPGIIDMIWTSIGATIDNRSASLIRELRVVANQVIGADKGVRISTAVVDFDMIRSPACRHDFAHLPTNWNLKDHQVDSLMEMASAMVRAAPDLQELAFRLGGTLEAPANPDGTNGWPGQKRARQACARLAGGDGASLPAPSFGNGE
jgi:NTE family protein